MTRNVTVTFEDGTQHVYQNVPDDATPDSVIARAGQDFSGKTITNVDGGRAGTTTATGAVTPTDISSEPGFGIPQIATVARDLANPIKDITGTAYNVGKSIIGYPVDVARNAMNWTPQSVAQVVTNPISTAKAYMYHHPVYEALMESNTPLKQLGKQAIGRAGEMASNIGSRVVSGLTAPEGLMALPYQMAAYEQEKIRANPTAPEYATNPYAQAYRGEAPTQGAAGAANRRNAIASQQYGGLTQEEQDILEQDRIAREIRRKAAEKVLGPVAPGGF